MFNSVTNCGINLQINILRLIMKILIAKFILMNGIKSHFHVQCYKTVTFDIQSQVANETLTIIIKHKIIHILYYFLFIILTYKNL